jgi:hypothetical protein
MPRAALACEYRGEPPAAGSDECHQLRCDDHHQQAPLVLLRLSAAWVDIVLPAASLHHGTVGCQSVLEPPSDCTNEGGDRGPRGVTMGHGGARREVGGGVGWGCEHGRVRGLRARKRGGAV